MNKENIMFHAYAIGDNLNEGYPVTVTTIGGNEIILNSEWNHGNIHYYYTYKGARFTYATLDGMLLSIAAKKFRVKDIKY